MNKNLILSLVSLLLGLDLTAHADIGEEYYRGMYCQKQSVTAHLEGEISIEGAVRCKTLYSEIQLIEVVVSDKAYVKEFYIFDHSAPREKQQIKGFHAKSFDHWDQANSGAVLYLGKRYTGQDVFLIRLVDSFRPTPSGILDIYVKMGGLQYQATQIKIAP